MKLLELSKERLKEEDKRLFQDIINDYNYDLVIFVAKGAYYIGKDLAELNNAPLLEIFAKRKGGRLKKMFSPILKVMPSFIKSYLRKKEFKSNYHEKNIERSVYFNEISWKSFKDSKKILLVDDSIDTGYTIKYAKEMVEKYFKESEVRIASLNVFLKSKSVVASQYFIYEDIMILGPWSNDSSENASFLNDYYEWHNGQE